MAKIKDSDGKFTLDPTEAITEIQLLTKTSNEDDLALANIQLDRGEPLFDPNNDEGKHLHIGTGNAAEPKISFYDAAEIDAKIDALDYNTTRTSDNDFAYQVTQTDGIIDVKYTQPAASNISYDNTNSAFTATDVQSAIDEEVKARIDAIEALDSSSTEASAGSFLTQVTITDGKITDQKTASNAATSSRWKDARTITLEGGVSGSVSIDGSTNVSISTTVTDNSHNHTIANVDELQDELNGKAPNNHATDTTTYGVATTAYFGHVKIGDNIDIADGTISIPAAGSALGLVKSGGDVTISDGVITVNDDSHNHKYAGSSSAGGAATSANKLNTDAGSATQPVYFANGVPAATTYTLGTDVPSDAVFTDTGATSVAVTGTGNAITGVSYTANSRTLTFTKGATYNNYTLPSASTSIKGGIKVGSHLSIADDVLSVNPDFGTTVQIKAGSFNAYSDARLKENFRLLTLEKSILDLPTYKFDFIDGSKNQIGCKAQDLQEICPEIVNEGSDGYLSIQESKIVYLLLEEVKKLRKEVDKLKGGE